MLRTFINWSFIKFYNLFESGNYKEVEKNDDFDLFVKHKLEQSRKIMLLDKEFPKILYLCGNVRFKDEFDKIFYNETLKGSIVLFINFFIHPKTIKKEQKDKLDKLNRYKIDIADEVIIINKDNYIGYSTRKEIEYATKQKKVIKYLYNKNGKRNEAKK